MKKIIAVLLCIITLFTAFSFCVSAASELGKPEKVVAEATSGTVKLTWTAVEGATGYRIYQKTESGWKSIKDTKATSYNISKLAAGNTYTFAVRAGVIENGKVYLSKTYVKVTAKTKSLKASVVSAVAGTNAVKLNWTVVEGAEGYCVYQYISNKWKRIKVLEKSTKSSFTVSDLKSNKNYYFAVRPYSYVSKKAVLGPASNILKVRTLDINKVTVKCTAVSEKAAKLQWTKAPNAKGYAVYAYVSGKWKLVKNITSGTTLSVVISGLKSDSTYYFRVRAYKKSGSNVQWFTASDYCKAVTNPSISNLTNNYTDKLKNIFNSSEYTFSYKNYNDKYGYIPVTVKKYNGEYLLISSVNEFKYKLLNTADDSYIVLDENEAYIKVPDLISSVLSVKNTMEDFLPGDSWRKTASIEPFDSKMAVCEAYTNPDDGFTLKFYYKLGTLIGIDEVKKNGDIERAYVSKISSSCDGEGFTIPENYTRLFYTFAIQEIIDMFK